MDIQILVETGETCGFQIKEVTSDSVYLPESEDYIKGRFKYSDTLSISWLALCKSTSEYPEYYGEPDFNWHVDTFKNSYIPVAFDGHFKLNYIVLPTDEWVFQKNGKDHVSEYSEGLFYSDGSKIYKYNAESGTGEEILLTDFQKILNSLIEDKPIINIKNTTLSVVLNDYVSICYLKKCFINLCKLILEKRAFGKCEYKGTLSSLWIYNRDLVWMAINVISYLTEFGLLNEAQRIIEIISNCNGVCQQYYRKDHLHQCGCTLV